MGGGGGRIREGGFVFLFFFEFCTAVSCFVGNSLGFFSFFFSGVFAAGVLPPPFPLIPGGVLAVFVSGGSEEGPEKGSFGIVLERL